MRISSIVPLALTQITTHSTPSMRKPERLPSSGSTGAPQYFMDLAFDRDGNMFGVTTTLNPSLVPALLYRIDPATGTATKIVNLVGSNTVMGLAFGRDGKLYATDFTNNPGLYLIDPKTGFETAIAALPFGLSSALELANPRPMPDDRK